MAERRRPRGAGAILGAWGWFLRTYRRFGKARLELPAHILARGELVASLTGWFVALDPVGGSAG